MNFTNYLIQSGINPQMVYFLVALPFAALLVSFLRQFIGLKAFSMYEPLVVAYCLFAISPNFIFGLRYGLPILAITWAVSEVLRRMLEKTRLHYISKVSLKISLVSLILLAGLSFAAYYSKTGYFAINPLPIIVIIALVESMSLFQIKAGALKTNLITLETLIVSILTYALISWNAFEVFVLKYCYLVILPIIGNFVVGQWRGLRLSEFIRFRNVLKND